MWCHSHIWNWSGNIRCPYHLHVITSLPLDSGDAIKEAVGSDDPMEQKMLALPHKFLPLCWYKKWLWTNWKMLGILWLNDNYVDVQWQILKDAKYYLKGPSNTHLELLRTPTSVPDFKQPKTFALCGKKKNLVKWEIHQMRLTSLYRYMHFCLSWNISFEFYAYIFQKYKIRYRRYMFCLCRAIFYGVFIILVVFFNCFQVLSLMLKQYYPIGVATDRRWRCRTSACDTFIPLKELVVLNLRKTFEM